VTSDPAPLLAALDLRVRRGRTEVLHGLDLDVRRGEVVAVLGPNGVGKSTLLRALGGLLRPSGGAVSRHGRVATALQSPDLARGSARTNVELALSWWGVPRRARRSRATAALQAMHAEHLSGRWGAAMSGGEQRRVHLARAVAVRPDVLLLDEPFAGLDAETRDDLLSDAGAALRSEAGAVVLVVHDRAEAWALADRLVVMLDGRIAADGSPHDVMEVPPSQAVARFLGFTGEVREADSVLLTRSSHVVVDPTGDLPALVTRVVPMEDGARLELDVADGHVAAVVPFGSARLGDQLRVRLVGGVRYPLPVAAL
jgi:ABC-type sulfate/molybdate transport systems ATPase subunit